LVVLEQEQDMSYTWKFEDPKHFEVSKKDKRHQGTEIEENQVRSQNRKNRTIQFYYLIFPE
jgi:hypothetical protein